MRISDWSSDVCSSDLTLSPIWDTALAALALIEAGESGDSPAIRHAMQWLADAQITEVKGDWAEVRPDKPPGGWPFQDRKSVVAGKGVSVRVDLGGRRIIKHTNKQYSTRS